MEIRVEKRDSDGQPTIVTVVDTDSDIEERNERRREQEERARQVREAFLAGYRNGRVRLKSPAPGDRGPVSDSNYRAELRAQFLEQISAYSEDHWCAGWYSGVDQIVRKNGGIWLAMAVACGGWPNGYMAEGGWDPLTAQERAEWYSISADREAPGVEGTHQA